MSTTFAVSGQHYLFSVQSFAQAVLAQGGEEYSYTFRSGTTQSVIDDVASGRSELGVLFETTDSKAKIEAALAEAGVKFNVLAESSPRVALPASHPLVNASKLSLDDLADYPYVYFEQETDDPAFAEEALADAPHAKSIAVTDRASLSELIVALNGYTTTSGILVGISDGSALTTVPLETDTKLSLGIVVKDETILSPIGQRFVDSLKKHLARYARP